MQSTRWPLALVAASLCVLATGVACSAPPSNAATNGDDSTAGKSAPKQAASASTAVAQQPPAPKSTGLPCDVNAVLVKNCQSCHGAKPAPGAEHTLVTWDDLQMVHDDGDKLYQAVEEKIHATTERMPPAAPLTDAEMKVIDDWVAGGAKKSDATCTAESVNTSQTTTTAAADAGAPIKPPTSCTSDRVCALGQICTAARCVAGCRVSTDCPGNAQCFGGQCAGVAVPGNPPPGSSSSGSFCFGSFCF